MFIKVKLKPNSKKQKIIRKSERDIEIWVKSKAERNLANLEMLEILSVFLGIEKNKIIIVSGHRRPNKMLKIIFD